jgi:hypothetical protein
MRRAELSQLVLREPVRENRRALAQFYPQEDLSRMKTGIPMALHPAAGWCKMRMWTARSISVTVLLMFGISTAHANLIEGFDAAGNSVPTPTGIFVSGWLNVNNSDHPNTTGFNWEGGDSGVFGWNAQSPASSTTSFVQDSFQSSTGSVLSDWLLTPVLSLQNGDVLSFYTVAAKNTTFANDLQVYVSQNGASTNVGSNAQTPTGGDFQLLPGGDLNPTLSPTGYPLTLPNGWTLETFTLTGITPGATGRIGLRYYIPNLATQGSEIGIDTFSFTTPTTATPEPAVWLCCSLGLALGAASKLRRHRPR